MYRVSADIGGTFTDIVVDDTENNSIKTIKVLSTPENPANAVFNGLNSNLEIYSKKASFMRPFFLHKSITNNFPLLR